VYPQTDRYHPYLAGDFQLMKVSEFPGRIGPDGEPSEFQVIPAAERISIAEIWKQLAPLSGHWCWVQWMDNRTIWVWDAEMTSEPCWLPADQSNPTERHFKHAESALLAVFVQSGPDGAWSLPFKSRRSPGVKVAAHVEATTEASPNCELSIISSFSTEGMSHVLRNWPREREETIRACEYYAFMHKDPLLLQLHRGMGGSRLLSGSLSALEVMARASENKDLISSVAHDLTHAFNSLDPAVSIVALASYLPELSSHNSQTAIAAVSFLVRFASELRRTGQDNKRSC
jgi:hypothetical protein